MRHFLGTKHGVRRFSVLSSCKYRQLTCRSIRANAQDPLKFREVAVYRSAKKADTYLYVPVETGLDALPDELSRLFGRAIFAMELVITPELKMSRLNAAEVLSALADVGYVLQLPPPSNAPVLHERLTE